MRNWLDTLNYSVQRNEEDEALWSYRVTPLHAASWMTYDVKQLSEHPTVLVISANVRLVGDLQNRINNLSQAQLDRLAINIRLELVRTGIGFANIQSPLQDVMLVETRLPISDSLSEYDFVAALAKMEGGLISVMSLLQLHLNIDDLAAL